MENGTSCQNCPNAIMNRLIWIARRNNVFHHFVETIDNIRSPNTSLHLSSWAESKDWTDDSSDIRRKEKPMMLHGVYPTVDSSMEFTPLFVLRWSLPAVDSSTPLRVTAGGTQHDSRRGSAWQQGEFRVTAGRALHDSRWSSEWKEQDSM